MTPEIKKNVYTILREQKGVITLEQALEAGLTVSFIKNRLRSGRWRRVHWSVYATVTGALPREAQLWAAVKRAGQGAVLSHWTAAELLGLIDKPVRVIHVTVPEKSNPARYGKIVGVKVHRSDLFLRDESLAHKTLPCTRAEDTVIDLVNKAENFDAAYNWICRALGRRYTTPGRLHMAMKARKRVRYRHDIEHVLQAANGALSWLEVRYVQGVEIPHGLPQATRQALVRQDTRNKYMDNLYEDYLACIELDGAVAHPEDEQWRDKDRDRWNLVHRKIVTVRFGVRHLRTDEDLCETATEVAKILNDRGPAVGHPCTRLACPVPPKPTECNCGAKSDIRS